MVQYDSLGINIMAFDLLATISNHLPYLEDWIPGTNSHGESRVTPSEPWNYVMFATKLTAEFAIDPTVGSPGPMWPYRDTDPHIVALNHNQLAWYCWTPGNPEPNLQPWGRFCVPTWDFGTIPPGASVQRLLKFAVDGAGLPPTDPRHTVILDSLRGNKDVLLNRTTSLKISTWIDDIALDNNVPYPELPLRSSDCSVFHDTEVHPILIAATLDWDWVYQNHPLSTLWRHKCVLTIVIIYDANGNSTYTVTVSENPASLGHVIIQPTANPLVWDILGGNGAAVPPDPVGPVILDIAVTGNEYGGTGTAQVNLTVRLLGDINGDGSVTGLDKIQMNKCLNGLPTPGYQTRHFDLNGDGAATGLDKLILNKLLNGIPVP